MHSFLKKRWFLVALALLIPGGLVLGAQLSDQTMARAAAASGETGQWLAARLPRIVTAVVLFLMSFSLDSRQLQASLRSPRPVLWASLVNYGLIPLLAWPLLALQFNIDFSIGLMIAASAPCTMAAASVWTRKAGGNDAVSLMVTLLTNGLCFLITPLWLNLTVAGSSEVQLDAVAMVWRLVTAVLVPSLLGQSLRQFRGPAAVAVKYKTPIGVVAQSCILLIVVVAAFTAGRRLAGTEGSPGLTAVVLVWSCAVALHLAGMGLAVAGSRKFGFSRADIAATAFAGSQKTLPIGVLVATDPTMFGNPDLLGPGLGVPFAVFPMLMYHASQLFLDTAVADRFAASAAEEAESAGTPAAAIADR